MRTHVCMSTYYVHVLDIAEQFVCRTYLGNGVVVHCYLHVLLDSIDIITCYE